MYYLIRMFPCCITLSIGVPRVMLEIRHMLATAMMSLRAQSDVIHPPVPNDHGFRSV
jgi:hypothetical protein